MKGRALRLSALFILVVAVSANVVAADERPNGHLPEDFLRIAVQLAWENVVKAHGGPFGAVIVKDGRIIATGRNEVRATNDPTAHAEIQAIREACRRLHSVRLTGCEIYTSCEPCPMCLGAIYEARLKAVYHCYTAEEAALIGFDDGSLYEQFALPPGERSIPMVKLPRPASAPDPFEAWRLRQR